MAYVLAIALLLSSFYGLIRAQYNFNPYQNQGGPYPFASPNCNPMFGPPGPMIDPRNSAGSGNNNYNSYNGANNNGPDGNNGDSLASLGLGGLSGFYSALSNELVYAGNNVGNSGPSNANGPSRDLNNNNKGVNGSNSSNSTAPAFAQSNGQNNGVRKPAIVNNVNLGDTSVLQQMGLQQLGSFFGSMVNELNNAGNNGGLNGQPPGVEGNNDNSPTTTQLPPVSSQASLDTTSNPS